MHVFTFFYIVLGAVCAVTAQEQVANIDYGDSTPPTDIPVVFAKGKISLPESWEEKITFTSDGSEMFFGRHPDGGKNYFNPKVMHAIYENDQWSKPEVAKFSIDRPMGWPLYSRNGNMLFVEEYEGKIAFSRLKNSQWSEVEQIVPEVDAERGFGLAQKTDDSTFYFHDRHNRIAYSTKQVDGKFTKPQQLSYRINPCVEFFVSPKNDYIIFQPLNWSNQFHISFKDAHGNWDMPIPFSTYFTKKWNGRGNGPCVSPDGKYLFFGKAGDIYWVKADFIEVLRKHVRTD